MGNQQAKVSDSEYGWVAGFFDGEGSVLLCVRSKAGKNLAPKVQPACKVQATDVASLEKMVDILIRAEIPHHVTWTQPRGFARSGRAYKPAWGITMAGLRRSLRFLNWITPGLATKRERAELCLDYIAKRLLHSDPRTPITEDEFALVLKMRELNMGKRPTSIQLNHEAPGAPSWKLAEAGRKGAQARWGV